MPGQIYPGSCSFALLAHEFQNGPPPPGYKYSCLPFLIPELGSFAIIYTIGVAATYLVQTVHERTGSYADDVEVTTTHWRWSPGADPAGSDFEVVTDRLHDFWTAITAYRTTGVAVREHRWYVADPAPGPPNPTLLVTADAIAGSSGSKPLPPQCAVTVTQMTDDRRRWGRFYIPGLTVDVLAVGSGRLIADVADDLATQAGLAFANSHINWKLQVFGSGSPASLPVRNVRVDDVFDIQRRRRSSMALHRATVSLD